MNEVCKASSLAVVYLLLWSGTAYTQVDAEPAAEPVQPVLKKRVAQVHDPSTIVQDGAEFWIFSTGVGISSSRSTDLVNWQAGPPVFDVVPEWTQAAIPRNRNGHFWAPDVIQSFEERDDYNAIDPALILNQDERLWMPFGSFWGGIQMIELDKAIGKRVGRSRSIIGPYLDRDGQDMKDEGGSLLLETQADFIGPGHAGVFPYQGTDWFAVHFYDGTTERSTSVLGMAEIAWGVDGCPVVVESRY